MTQGKHPIEHGQLETAFLRQACTVELWFIRWLGQGTTQWFPMHKTNEQQPVLDTDTRHLFETYPKKLGHYAIEHFLVEQADEDQLVITAVDSRDKPLSPNLELSVDVQLMTAIPTGSVYTPVTSRPGVPHIVTKQEGNKELARFVCPTFD